MNHSGKPRITILVMLRREPIRRRKNDEPSSADAERGTMRFGDHTTGTALYFSYVTLTTLGYGDIAPVSMSARLLTTAEALIGQIYLVVLVARLVGVHIANEMRESRDE